MTRSFALWIVVGCAMLARASPGFAQAAVDESRDFAGQGAYCGAAQLELIAAITEWNSFQTAVKQARDLDPEANAFLLREDAAGWAAQIGMKAVAKALFEIDVAARDEQIEALYDHPAPGERV